MDSKEMVFTEEQIQKARGCKSAEEICVLAKESGMAISEEEAKVIYEKLNPVNGEISDDELDSVTGGGCITDLLFGKSNSESSSPVNSISNPGVTTLGNATGNPNSGHISNTIYKTVSGGASTSDSKKGGGVVPC